MLQRKPHSLAEVISALPVNDLLLLLADSPSQNSELPAERDFFFIFFLFSFESLSADLTALVCVCVIGRVERMLRFVWDSSPEVAVRLHQGVGPAIWLHQALSRWAGQGFLLLLY